MIPTTNDSAFQVSTDRTRLDIPMIYRFLSEQSTWAVGISRTVVERSIENSLCFGGYIDGRQIAFARVITDYATMAHLADVFVVPEYRGRGYAKQLLRIVPVQPKRFLRIGVLAVLNGPQRNRDVRLRDGEVQNDLDFRMRQEFIDRQHLRNVKLLGLSLCRVLSPDAAKPI